MICQDYSDPGKGHIETANRRMLYVLCRSSEYVVYSGCISNWRQSVHPMLGTLLTLGSR